MQRGGALTTYTDADYLRWGPFDGADRDVKIAARDVRIVTTRKPQRCNGDDGAASSHEMPAGTRARYEHALVDGEWGSWYICLACMDKFLVERQIPPAMNLAFTSGDPDPFKTLPAERRFFIHKGSEQE